MALRRVLFFAAATSGCSGTTVYNPPEAGVALDAIEKALANIVNSPHLSKKQMDEAKKVTTDVEKTVKELSSDESKKLSQDARAKKVRAAIGELMELQANWEKAAQVPEKAALLKKELEEKQKELEKDKKMLKVLNLEKALAEKKLKLQKLIDTKHKDAATKKAEEEAKEEADQQQKMVKDSDDAVKALKTTKDKKEISEKLKPVKADVDTRIKKVQVKVDSLDKDEKKKQEQVDAMTSKKMPVKDASDPLAKGQGVLKMLMKKEHRQYQKTRVIFTNELKQLKEASADIEKSDVDGLSKVMKKLSSEMKAEAKGHKFLY